MAVKNLAWGAVMLLMGSACAAPPQIVAQSGSFEVREGEAFAVQLVASGDGLGFRWFHDGEELAGQTGATLVLSAVSPADAGAYEALVSNGAGEARSEPVTLAVETGPSPGVTPGTSGIVAVPGHPAYYELYLPSTYRGRQRAFPVLFTFNPGGGGMVAHFRAVAEEKQWIVVGVSQSRNNQGLKESAIYSRAVFRHVFDHLKVDPGRIFASGFSGGGWASFEVAKRYSPLVAGVFSMGGWLGRQDSYDRDIYLPGLLVARSNGDSDEGANWWMASDRGHLSHWIASELIRDWSFPGGHAASPQWVQREVFDWFLSLSQPASSAELDHAREQEAIWKARITAGETAAVYEELVFIAFNLPRTAESLAAWKTMDFLFARDELFLRDAPADFTGFPRRNYFAVKLYHDLYAFMHRRDPSMQFSAVAAAMALGDVFRAVQEFPVEEAQHILRHPAHTPFDAFVLEHGLHGRSELPLRGDWDGDGRENLGEVVTGTAPLVADRAAQPAIVSGSGGVYASLSGCRVGMMTRLVPMVTDDPGVAPWVEVPTAERTLHPEAEGRSVLGCRLGDPAQEPKLFVRFEASMDAGRWHDANGDGIPHEYQFPGEDPSGDSPDLADARTDTDVPGGPPRYLRYLTAAEIGAVGNTRESLRYHPALTGYRGYLFHEVWMDVSATSIAAAEAEVAGRAPDDARLITSSEAPWFGEEGAGVMGDRYFERTRGYVVPNVSGDHVFSISGDDDCELWFSSRGTRAAATRIASVSGWTSLREFDRNPSQTSAAISLQAGRAYYIEILHREGNGGDHCSVAWTPPGSSEPAIISSTNLQCLSAGQIDLSDN